MNLSTDGRLALSRENQEEPMSCFTHEVLLSKADVDRVFTLNKNQWNAVATQLVATGWETNTYDHDDGTQVVGFDPLSGRGLSMLPFFENDTSIPGLVIVGNYYPVGTLPPMTEQLRSQIIAVARENIGSAYSLHFIHSVTENVEGYEFLITELLSQLAEVK